MKKLTALPELRDVATDQQTSGLAASLVIDRVTASRMGITPSMIDQTLYDAFGQRQISTLYTQLNQYHVILETMPSFQKNPSKLGEIYVRSALASGATATASPSSTVVTSTTASGTAGSPEGAHSCRPRKALALARGVIERRACELGVDLLAAFDADAQPLAGRDLRVPSRESSYVFRGDHDAPRL